MQDGHRPFREQGGPWYPALHMPGWGHKGCCSPQSWVPTVNCSSRELGKLTGFHLGGSQWGGGSRAVCISLSSPSMGSEAAEAKHRFPIKRLYLAPALLTLKQEGLKVNSLSIPYCQLIHHSTGAGLPKLSLPQPP